MDRYYHSAAQHNGIHGTRYYYITNLQGDVIFILDGNQTKVAEYSYDPYGKVTVTNHQGSIGTINPIRFRGYYYDEETKLYYVNQRYYDPETGRFINADNPQLLGANDRFLSYNLFAYADNDPVNKKDSNGELGILTSIAVGAVVSAVIGGVSSALQQYAENNGDIDWQHVIRDAASSAVSGAIGGILGAKGIEIGVKIAGSIIIGVVQGGMSYDLARDNNASVGKATIIFMLTTLTTGISTFAGSNNPPGCFTFEGEVRNTVLYNLILGTGADLLNNAYQEVLNDRISEREETEKSNYKTSNNPSGNHNASWGDDLKGKRMNKNYCIENPV